MVREITRYKVVQTNRMAQLIDEVNGAIDEGWEIVGPAMTCICPEAATTEATYYCHQTMVYKEECG